MFVNTALAQRWRDNVEETSKGELAAKAEAFSFEAAIPPEVLLLTAGTDMQDDRLECVITGWAKDNTCFVLNHTVFWGRYNGDTVWEELDDLLKSRFRHPLGGELRIAACCVDCGDGQHYSQVMAFSRPRTDRRVLPVKGVGGFSRPLIQPARSKKSAGRLCLVGRLHAPVRGGARRP